MDKLKDLSIEQQKRLIDFSINNINIIDNPDLEVIMYVLKSTNYDIGLFNEIDNPEIIRDICINAPQTIVNNRRRINASLNELYNYNPKILDYLNLIDLTKEPALLNTLSDDILLALFDRYSVKDEIKQSKNLNYSIGQTTIDKCDYRVQNLYKAWKIKK